MLLLSGCAAYATQQYDQRYGEASPQPRFRSLTDEDAQYFTHQVRPILERRCVVCHACNDAPCQLKLNSPHGIERGLHPDPIYNGSRLLAAAPTRLFQDAQTTSEWRDKGFQPVLNERSQNPSTNLTGSLIYRTLALKQRHANPTEDRLPDSFDLRLNREQQCLHVAQYDQIERERPLWGMPYGLPAVSDTEHAAIKRWLERGAVMPQPQPPGEIAQALIDHWERFLNQDRFRAQLVARYLYEHLFLYNLYFEQLPDRYYFNLVRSATPPGEPVQRISTRRPYDDPQVDRVYYRLVPLHSSIVAKTHIPFALGPDRQQRWQTLFFEPDYAVDRLPGYDPEEASNPFITFAALPAASRYRFLLDEAQTTIMAFIKGPVCRGQVAVNVINEQFWVFFVRPDAGYSDEVDKLLTASRQQLALPAGDGSSVLPISTWLKYAAQQAQYLETKSAWMNEQLARGVKLNEQLIWDGDGSNSNAALTIFRHFDNASVSRGLIGPAPKTAWVIDYPLLERIHYLLVAGFDVYGNLGHQLATRLYMDFLRMEGEFNFLALLPASARKAERDFWYRDSGTGVRSYVFGRHSELYAEPAIRYQSDTPKMELFKRLESHLAPVLTRAHQLENSLLSEPSIRHLRELESQVGGGIALLPEQALLLVRTATGTDQLLTLVHHRAHANISSLFDEQEALLPEEDRLSVVAGVIGDYPNLLLQIDEADIPQLVAGVKKLTDENSYRDWVGHYGVRRTDSDFWRLSDRIAELYPMLAPGQAGILDYNRLENR